MAKFSIDKARDHLKTIYNDDGVINMNEPVLMTTLTPEQKSKNTLLDDIHDFRKRSYTKRGDLRRKPVFLQQLNDLKVRSTDMGYFFSGSNRDLCTLYQDDKDFKRVGKTPVRYDYSATPSVIDDPKIYQTFCLLEENNYIAHIQIGHLKPSEIMNAAEDVRIDNRNRLTYEMHQAMTDIVETNHVVMVNRAGRYRETLLISLTDIIDYAPVTDTGGHTFDVTRRMTF